MKKLIVMAMVLVAVLMAPVAMGSWFDDFEDEADISGDVPLSSPWESVLDCGGFAGIGYEGTVGVRGFAGGWDYGSAFRPIDIGSNVIYAKVKCSEATLYPALGLGVIGTKTISGSQNWMGGNDADVVYLNLYAQPPRHGPDHLGLKLVSEDWEAGVKEVETYIRVSGSVVTSGWPAAIKKLRSCHRRSPGESGWKVGGQRKKGSQHGPSHMAHH